MPMPQLLTTTDLDQILWKMMNYLQSKRVKTHE